MAANVLRRYHQALLTTQELLIDPVVASDGESYERVAVKVWLAENGAVSPTTGLVLDNCDLVPNRALRSTISNHR